MIPLMRVQNGNIKLANHYRELALKGIELSLHGKLKENKRLEYLYFAANYHSQFGHQKESDSFLLKVEDALSLVEKTGCSQIQPVVLMPVPYSIV